MGLGRWFRPTSKFRPKARTSSASRRSASNANPSPGRRPAPTLNTLDEVVHHYRRDLVKIHQRLEDALIAFDREPDEYSLTLVIRKLRGRLDEALEVYFSAAGSRSVDRIEPVLDCAARVDIRLASLDEEVCAEVSRFESAADEISMYVRPGAPAGARKLYAADANELLLELVVYRTSWDCAIQGREAGRLDCVETMLRSILDAGPAAPSAPPLPIIRAVNDDHLLEDVSSSPTPSSSSSDGTFASTLRRPRHTHPKPNMMPSEDARKGASKPSRQHRRPRAAEKSRSSEASGWSKQSSSPVHSGSSNSRPQKIGAREEFKHIGSGGLPSRESAPDYLRPANSCRELREDRVEPGAFKDCKSCDYHGDHKADHSWSSHSSAEAAARAPVLARSRTLRDMAAAARSIAANGGQVDIHEEDASSVAASIFSEYAKLADAPPSAPANASVRKPSEPGPSEDPATSQPGLAPGKSFSSILYTTQNARSEALSDRGLGFRAIQVRGDGRCLFRSVARSRDVSRGNPEMSERAERDMADDLRSRTVKELKRHRELLTQFYVIETDFSRYCKRMSNPRTFGGEPELLVLAKILHCPIAVYILVNGRYKQIQV